MQCCEKLWTRSCTVWVWDAQRNFCVEDGCFPLCTAKMEKPVMTSSKHLGSEQTSEVSQLFSASSLLISQGLSPQLSLLSIILSYKAISPWREHQESFCLHHAVGSANVIWVLKKKTNQLEADSGLTCVQILIFINIYLPKGMWESSESKHWRKIIGWRSQSFFWNLFQNS